MTTPDPHATPLNHPVALVWFRRDLRLIDNPALFHALAYAQAAGNGSLIALFVHEPHSNLGAASQWWLRNSLQALSAALEHRVHVVSGEAAAVLQAYVKQYPSLRAVFWNRLYEPLTIARDTGIKKELRAQAITVHSYADYYLWEPWRIQKSDTTPYRVFTPYYQKGCMLGPSPRVCVQTPKLSPQLFLAPEPPADTRFCLEKLLPLPAVPWDHKLAQYWETGEKAAQSRWQAFVHNGLLGYAEGRNFPNQPHVSRLSPALHWGEISAHQLYWDLQGLSDSRLQHDAGHFLRELAWREFSGYLLYHFPTLPHEPFQAKFSKYPWQSPAEAPKDWHAWIRGKTGYPLVDAGMRELWETGYMHNRVRMITASFLVKNLHIHWQYGADWFFDCLVDANLANNSASWQWVAGTGADAAPYFRIFNPILQAQKFDPSEAYIRRYVPEYGSLHYPAPIIDWSTSRARALDTYGQWNSSRSAK